MIWSILALGMTVVLVVVYEIRLTKTTKMKDNYKAMFENEKKVTVLLAEGIGELEFRLAHANEAIARQADELATLKGEWLATKGIDPKDHEFHSTSADLWDMREGK